MRAINISNIKARNVQVGFEQKGIKPTVTMQREDGMGYTNARFLKATPATSIEVLYDKFGENLADEIINGDPEIDLEMVGMRLGKVKKVFLDNKGKVAHRVLRQQVRYSPEGEEMEVKKFHTTESNVNIDFPLRWTGKFIPKDKAVRTFAFVRKYQLKHINGLTFDFLYDMAKMLDEIGENDLKPNVLPLHATLLNRSVFRNGKRNSASVFGNDAMLDEVEVDVLSRPLTSTQIKAILPTLTSTDVLIKQLKAHCKQKADNIKAYYIQLQNDATRQLNLLRSSGAHYTPSHVAQLEERANNTDMMNAQIEKVETQTGLLCELIKNFTNGQAVGIPMALVAEGEIEDNRLVDYVSIGLFLGFKVVGSKTTRSSIKAVFVVNDGRCRLDIPLTEEGKLMTIHNQTNLGVMRQRLSKVTIDTWDSLLSNSTRERAYIVTGNLLSGIAYAKEFGKNVGNRKLRQIAMNKGRGHLITYTDDMGRVKNGYMLSRMFRPTDLQLYAPKP